VNIRGLIMTLKLPDWNLVEQIPAYIERIRSWGFPDVKAKQLAHNRQEICVAALRGEVKHKPAATSPRAQRAQSKRPKR
jgi:23S rRNA (cytidine2498-2'-O)-methyltransferase